MRKDLEQAVCIVCGSRFLRNKIIKNDYCYKKICQIKKRENDNPIMFASIGSPDNATPDFDDWPQNYTRGEYT